MNIDILFLLGVIPMALASGYVWYTLLKEERYDGFRSKVRKATRILSTKLRTYCPKAT